MTNEDALEIARYWVLHRVAVRKQLIALAREANPIDAKVGLPVDGQGIERDIRKLWQFPSDLSEERLLNLIDNGKLP
jgi:hypothetical protein